MTDHDPQNASSPWPVFEVKFARTGGRMGMEVWHKSVYVRAANPSEATKAVVDDFSPEDKACEWIHVATDGM